ncbi:hypothetical protein HAX54_034936, partial [Datura stramonium]|nr:hypothetical protein [Datura stramonium]
DIDKEVGVENLAQASFDLQRDCQRNPLRRRRKEMMEQLMTQTMVLTKHVMRVETRNVNSIGSNYMGPKNEECYQVYEKEVNCVSIEWRVPNQTNKDLIKDFGSKVKGIKDGIRDNINKAREYEG